MCSGLRAVQGWNGLRPPQSQPPSWLRAGAEHQGTPQLHASATRLCGLGDRIRVAQPEVLVLQGETEAHIHSAVDPVYRATGGLGDCSGRVLGVVRSHIGHNQFQILILGWSS